MIDFKQYIAQVIAKALEMDEKEISIENPKGADNLYEIFELINVLVDGPFVEDLKQLDLKFRGSSNQRLVNFDKTEFIRENNKIKIHKGIIFIFNNIKLIFAIRYIMNLGGLFRNMNESIN